jgi:hypothetical protein
LGNHNNKEIPFPYTQIDKNGKIQQITESANEIEKIANWIGTGIGPAVKIQKFLESMHDILRAQVEPLIKERKEENWPEIKELAEKYDSVLYQSKRYKQTNQSNGNRHPKTAAIEQPKFSYKRNKARLTNTNRKKISTEERSRLRNKGRCFFCKETEHQVL